MLFSSSLKSSCLFLNPAAFWVALDLLQRELSWARNTNTQPLLMCHTWKWVAALHLLFWVSFSSAHLVSCNTPCWHLLITFSLSLVCWFLQPGLFRPLETRKIVQVWASSHGRKCFLLNRFSLGMMVWMNGSQLKIAKGCKWDTFWAFSATGKLQPWWRNETEPVKILFSWKQFVLYNPYRSWSAILW